MTALSRREQIFGLIFLVSLVWGVWNYRHLFMSKDRTAQNVAQPVSGAESGAPDSSAIVSPVDTPLVLQASWGSDPFNRPWRMTRTVTPIAPGVVLK